MSKTPVSMRKSPHDPDVVSMQAQWHEARAKWVSEGSPDSGSSWHAFSHIETKLRMHLWDKASKEIAADRAAHPRARRNAPLVRNEISNRAIL